jgi:WD40 repeat protein
MGKDQIMKGGRNIVWIILGIILLATFASVKELGKKIDKMSTDIKSQGEKISVLYDVVNVEMDLESKKGYLEEKKREKQLDQKLALPVVQEFKNPQYSYKAKFHPQKNTFAVVVGDGTLKFFDAMTAQEIKSLRVPDEVINCFAYLYDGKRMVLGTKSGKIYLADLETGQATLVDTIGNRAIARLDAGRNGNVAIGLGGDFEVSKTGSSGFVYDLNAKKVLSKYEAFFREDFQGIAISPAGDVVVIDEVNGKERGSCLFDATTGDLIKLCYHSKYGSGPLSVDIAPDGNTMAVGYAPYHVIVWNGREGTVQWLLEGHSNWVVSLDFSDDGKFLASGAGDSTARVYDLQTGKEIGRVRFSGSSTYVDSVDISSDGSLLLAAVDEFVGIYRMPKKVTSSE